jgi:periplasmic divalent cation tolerance protein
MPEQVHLVYTTASSEAEAARIATTVVDERLAACANIVPKIRSIYRWQGTVEDEAESLVFLKTRAKCVEALIARIGELHTYEVPDVVALPIEAGHRPYLDWVVENTGT